MTEVNDQEWETPCPNRQDNMHCDCWYDGEMCCACEDTPEMNDDDCDCDDIPEGDHEVNCACCNYDDKEVT